MEISRINPAPGPSLASTFLFFFSTDGRPSLAVAAGVKSPVPFRPIYPPPRPRRRDGICDCDTSPGVRYALAPGLLFGSLTPARSVNAHRTSTSAGGSTAARSQGVWEWEWEEGMLCAKFASIPSPIIREEITG